MEHLGDGRLESLERQSSGASAPASSRSEHGTLLATAVFNIDELVASFFNPEAPEDEEALDLGDFRQEYGGTVEKTVGDRNEAVLYEEYYGSLYAVKTDPGEVAFIWNGDEREDLFQEGNSSHPDIYGLPEVSGEEWESLDINYDENVSLPGSHEENLEMSKPESGSVMSGESRWGFRTGSIETVGEVYKKYREFLRANG
jgi:hypothetical protein